MSKNLRKTCDLMKPRWMLSPQYFRIGNGELMQATHSGRLGQWDGILYSEECKFNLMPVHWLDKVIYEDGESTIYHGKGQLRKKFGVRNLPDSCR